MTDSNYIQLSYQLIHLTREDLDVISCVNRNLPGLDLNAFSLSLLYLGYIFCTDKQKIFLNAPVQNEIKDMFAHPVRMKVGKNANPKLFHSIRRYPQGKLRRNYITAILHAGIAALIELSYIYRLYEANKEMASLYSVNSFLLRFGLSTCVETYSRFNTKNYIYDVKYLEKKYLDHINIQTQEITKEQRKQTPKKSIYNPSTSEKVTIQQVANDFADKNENSTEQKLSIDHLPTIGTTEESQIEPVVNAKTSEIVQVKSNQEISESKKESVPKNNDWIKKTFNPNLL